MCVLYSTTSETEDASTCVHCDSLHVGAEVSFSFKEEMCHESHVQNHVLKLLNFIIQNLQKPFMIDLRTRTTLYDDLWSLCYQAGPPDTPLKLNGSSAPM